MRHSVMVKNSLIAVFLLAPHFAGANIGAELGSYYGLNSGRSNDANVDTSSQLFYNFDLLVALSDDANAYFGFRGQSFSSAEKSAGVATSYTSIEVGPMVKYCFGDKKWLSLTAAYLFSAKAKYKTETATADWSGASYIVAAGIAPKVGKNFYFGFNLNYYSASYTTETISSTTVTAPRSRSYFFPTLTLSWRK